MVNRAYGELKIFAGTSHPELGEKSSAGDLISVFEFQRGWREKSWTTLTLSGWTTEKIGSTIGHLPAFGHERAPNFTNFTKSLIHAMSIGAGSSDSASFLSSICFLRISS